MTKALKLIMLIFLTFAIFCPQQVYATGFTGFDSMKSQADAWVQSGKNGAPIKENQIAEVLKPIASFLVAVGAVAVVAATIIMGIKYMSASDPSTQAKIKQQLIGLVVAAIIIFGAVGIWSLTYDFLSDIF